MKHKKDRESRKKFKPFRKIPKQVRDDPIYFTVQKLSTNYMTSTILIPKFRDEGSRLRNKFFGSE